MPLSRRPTSHLPTESQTLTIWPWDDLDLRQVKPSYTDVQVAKLAFFIRWPWPNDLDTQMWPRYGQDVTSYQKWSFYVNSFKVVARTDRHTDTQTRQKHYLYRIRGREKKSCHVTGEGICPNRRIIQRSLILTKPRQKAETWFHFYEKHATCQTSKYRTHTMVPKRLIHSDVRWKHRNSHRLPVGHQLFTSKQSILYVSWLLFFLYFALTKSLFCCFSEWITKGSLGTIVEKVGPNYYFPSTLKFVKMKILYHLSIFWYVCFPIGPLQQQSNIAE